MYELKNFSYIQNHKHGEFFLVKPGVKCVCVCMRERELEGCGVEEEEEEEEADYHTGTDTVWFALS